MATPQEMAALIASPNPLPSIIDAIGIVFIILPVIAAGMRFWARSLVKATLGVDDWLIFPALVFNLLTGAALVRCVAVGGLGAHMEPPMTADGGFIFTEVYRQYGIWKFMVQIFSTVTVSCTKLSLLFLYRRIFTVKWFLVLVNVWIGLIIAWTISFVLVLIFQCTPVSAFWSNYEWLIESSCIEELKFYLGITVSDFICDVIIVLLPIPVLWNLHLPMKTKLATVGIFLLGALVCAAGAVRLAFFFNTPVGSLDTTYNEAATLYWTYIEGAVAIIGACLPTLRPLFTRFFGTGLTTKGSGYSNSYGNSTKQSNVLRTDGSFSHLRSEERGDETMQVGHTTTVVSEKAAQEQRIRRDVQIREFETPRHGGIRADTTWNNTYERT